MELVLLAIEVLKKSPHTRKAFLAFDHQPLPLGRKICPWHVHRDSSLLCITLQFCEQRAVFRLGPRLNRPFVQALRLIRDNQRQIEIDSVPEALAARACAEWIIERKQPRLWFRISDTAALTFEPIRKAQTPRRFHAGNLVVSCSYFENDFATFAESDLGGVNDPRAG